MYNNNKILVVIPARGGSKRIPRKNTRLLADKPLIAYAIGTAKASKYVDDVVISTEDSEVMFIAEKLGTNVIRRSEELSGDTVPLDSIVYEAMLQKEKMAFDEYDIVITLLATSPLLETDTLDRAIEKFDDFAVDSVVAVCDDRHLNWGYDEKNKRYFPLYVKRDYPQNLPYSYKETGALLATRRHFVNENSRLGTNIEVIELSNRESITISDYSDWWAAEKYLQKKKVALIVNAYNEIGINHIYRCLAIASKLVSDDVVFFLNKDYQLGIDIISSNNYSYKIYRNSKELFKILREFNPEIIVNDILDTSYDYISALINEGYFVCNFEDLGSGSEVANVVFDDLYEHDLSKNNIFTGHKYYILKKEFFFQPHKVITHDVGNVLITFGNTDPNNFTEKVVDAILKSENHLRINVIVGRGYSNIDKLISKYESNPLVQIYKDVSKISDFMFQSDIIFTSADKTIYETCSLGIPTICLCQNDRERSHVFANFNNGFINMGLGSELSDEDILNQFDALVEDFDLRLELNKKMLRIDLKHGFDNVKHVIEEEYRKFELTKEF